MPRECLKISREQVQVCHREARPIVSSEFELFHPTQFHSVVAELKDMGNVYQPQNITPDFSSSKPLPAPLPPLQSMNECLAWRSRCKHHLMPLSIWKKLSILALTIKPDMILELAARTNSTAKTGHARMFSCVDGIYDSEGDTIYLEQLLSVINSDPNLPPSPVCEINVPDKIKSSCEDPPDLELKDFAILS
ncbi:hypothetical protein Tco_0281668 [Tanacetum coccineum]